METLIQPVHDRCKPLCSIEAGLLTYEKGSIYFERSDNAVRTRIATFPMPLVKRFLGRMRLFERILRLEPRTGVFVSDQLALVSFQGSMFSINLATNELVREHRFRVGVNNPLSISRLEGIEGFEDCVLYGEYWGNKDKEPVSVYARSLGPLPNWKKVFEFPKGTITHIHAIVPDPYRKGVLILTGDEDNESGIWLAKKSFADVQPIVIGKQSYRSCVAFPLKEGILFATDTPYEENHIAMLRWSGNAWSYEKLHPIDGSCIYGVRHENKYVFGTAVESDGAGSGLRFLLSYRLGAGIRSWHSTIVVGSPEDGFSCPAKLKKDLFPMVLCQYGAVAFCSSKRALFAYPMAVKGLDGKLVRISIEESCERE